MGNQTLSVHHIVNFTSELLCFLGKGALDLIFGALLNYFIIRLVHFYLTKHSEVAFLPTKGNRLYRKSCHFPTSFSICQLLRKSEEWPYYFFPIKYILSLCCSGFYCDMWVGKTIRVSFIISEKCDKRQTRRFNRVLMQGWLMNEHEKRTLVSQELDANQTNRTMQHYCQGKMDFCPW